MPLLQARGLKKTFKTRHQAVEAVRAISLSIEEGEVLGFLGPNGAGKTTTIKMIAGLIRPDAGSVRIEGLDPHVDPRALQSVGAILEGNRNLYWRLTALENIEYFGVLRGLKASVARHRGRELLERFGLADRLKTPVMQFSRGMQQKLALAVALVHEPRLLLLDEPTLGLDVEASETVKQLVQENVRQGRAILLTTHQLGVAEELSDRIAILRRGEMVAMEATDQLIRRFSGETHLIETRGGPLEPERVARLEAAGAWVRDGTVGYLGNAEGLYQILEILRPRPLVEVRRDQANLTGVFLHMVRGEDGEGNDG